jgi:hypothetical protein
MTGFGGLEQLTVHPDAFPRPIFEAALWFSEQHLPIRARRRVQLVDYR